VILIEKPEAKRLPGRPRRRWEDNIRMNFKDIGWGNVERIQLAQDTEKQRTVVNMARDLRVPKKAGTFLTS
jgi:hypothetical protein